MSNTDLYKETTTRLTNELRDISNELINENKNNPSQTVYDLDISSDFKLNNIFDVSNNENNILTENQNKTINKINFEYSEPIVILGDFENNISFSAPNIIISKCQKINNFAHVNLLIKNINYATTNALLSFTIDVTNIRNEIFESYDDAGGVCNSVSNIGFGRVEALPDTNKLIIYFYSENTLDSEINLSCMIKI